jgi:hypothetical protein
MTQVVSGQLEALVVVAGLQRVAGTQLVVLEMQVVFLQLKGMMAAKVLPRAVLLLAVVAVQVRWVVLVILQPVMMAVMEVMVAHQVLLGQQSQEVVEVVVIGLSLVVVRAVLVVEESQQVQLH